jgi:hypothetical protein
MWVSSKCAWRTGNMPSLSNHEGPQLVKGLVLGDPGSGKTGSLTSLVKAGYRLLIYDFDNLLTSLIAFVQHECPENLGNVEYQTFTDKLKGIDMPMTMAGSAMKIMPNNDGQPKAYVNAMKQLTKWNDPEGKDLGDPGALGLGTVVVIDSLTTLSNACMRYVQAMNPLAREPQAYYHAAQQLIMNMLQLLCSKDFNVNVLVLAHLAYTRRPRSKEAADNMTMHEQLELGKGFPRSVGSALNEVIAAHFNSCLLVEQANGKRVIHTKSTSLVDLKNPVPFAGLDKLPIETGMATFFEAINGKAAAANAA